MDAHVCCENITNCVADAVKTRNVYRLPLCGSDAVQFPFDKCWMRSGLFLAFHAYNIRSTLSIWDIYFDNRVVVALRYLIDESCTSASLRLVETMPLGQRWLLHHIASSHSHLLSRRIFDIGNRDATARNRSIMLNYLRPYCDILTNRHISHLNSWTQTRKMIHKISPAASSFAGLARSSSLLRLTSFRTLKPSIYW